jgi:hypothetical protein
MDEGERPPLLAEILGLTNENTAEGAAMRRFIELRFDSKTEFDDFTPRDRCLCNVVEYVEVVDNGGVHEFLCRLCGNRAIETLESLVAIGATSAATGLRQVFDLFPAKSPSRDQSIRNKQIEEICDSLPRDPDGRNGRYLDNIVTHYREENIFDLLMDYWQRHPIEPK